MTKIRNIFNSKVLAFLLPLLIWSGAAMASGLGAQRREIARAVAPADFGAIGEHVLPSAANTYDLGSTSKEWRVIYVGDGTSAAGTGGIYLGASQWWKLYADSGLNLNLLGAGSRAFTVSANGTGNGWVFNSLGDFTPTGASAFSVGSTSNEVANLYIGTGSVFFGAGQDAAITRNAAGVLQATDGSTGGGALLVGSGALNTTTPSLAAGDAAFGLSGATYSCVYDQTFNLWSFYYSNTATYLRVGGNTGSEVSFAEGGAVNFSTSSTNAAAAKAVQFKGWQTTLTDATATNVLTLTVATETSTGGSFVATVQATDGTDMQARTVTVHYCAVNKAGTVTATATVGTENVAVSTGTLTVTADTTTGAGTATIRLTATSSLTTTSLTANCVANHCASQAITPQ